MPENVLNNGIELILALQALGDWLIPLMSFFTSLGNEDFYFLVFPALFWCIDVKLGLRVGVFLILSTSLNSTFKLFWQEPRPFWTDARIRLLGAPETSFGLPSGHSQNAVAVWGGIATSVRRWWMWLAAVIVIFGIGFSRMYLGVHFPTDVYVGWAIGIALLVGVGLLEKPFLRWFEPLKMQAKIAAAAGFSLAMVLLAVIAGQVSADFSMPAQWANNYKVIAGAVDPDAVTNFHPLSLEGPISVAGTFLGLIVGLLVFNQQGWMDASGPWYKRALRYLVGLVGVLVFWRGLGLVLTPLAEQDTALAYLLRYIRYALVGGWIGWGAPLAFLRLGLARRKAK